MGSSCCSSKKKVVIENKYTQENPCLNVDRFGAIASFLCAIHCFITSIAMSVLSIAGLGFLGSEKADLIFVFFAITFGIMAVRHGYKHHHSYIPGLLFMIGLSMIFISHFWLGHAHHVSATHNALHKEESEFCFSDFLAVTGGITIMSFHLLNAKLQKKAKKLNCCSGI